MLHINIQKKKKKKKRKEKKTTTKKTNKHCYMKSKILVYIYIYIYIGKFRYTLMITSQIKFEASVWRLIVGQSWVQHEVVRSNPTRANFVAEGARNVSWPWLSPLQGWGSLTLASTSKFLYMVHHFILLWLNHVGRSVDRKSGWLEHSM